VFCVLCLKEARSIRRGREDIDFKGIKEQQVAKKMEMGKCFSKIPKFPP
jgi:hypothetical protein